jgi:hypothetical protein
MICALYWLLSMHRLLIVIWRFDLADPLSALAESSVTT